MHILYKYWLHERGPWEIVNPRKPMSTGAKPRLTLVFEGSTLRLVSKQSRSSEYLCFYFVLRIFKRSWMRRKWESMVNRTSINSAQSIIFKFWNITRRQPISPVATFHRVLGRGFMIQRVVLIFIKCLSAIRINYFTWKYNIYK